MQKKNKEKESEEAMRNLIKWEIHKKRSERATKEEIE